jgi:cytochrome b/b6/petB-like protein
VSGAALTPFYSPARALDSLERLQGGLPWGFFLRAIHAYSAYGFLAAAVGHLIQVLAARTDRRLSGGMWWGSVLLLLFLVAALLGGFALRADAAAAEALPVWRRILEAVPLAGAALSRLVLGVRTGDLGAVALHHSGTFTLLLWLLTSAHGERVLPDRRSTVIAALLSAAVAGAAPLPLGPPPNGTSETAPGVLLGPWYLLGLQGALMDLPVAAAWLGPLALVLLLGLLRHAERRMRHSLLAALGLWVAVYLGFTARVLLAAGR